MIRFRHTFVRDSSDLTNISEETRYVKSLLLSSVLVYGKSNNSVTVICLIAADTKVDASLVAEAVHMADLETTRETLATDAEPTLTTTMLPETTTLFLPENFSRFSRK